MIPQSVQELSSRLPPDYQDLLKDFFESPQYWADLEFLVSAEKSARQLHVGKIFPEYDDVFQALFQTPVKNIKAILIGQDPYHTPGLAHGLAFSIPEQIDPKSKSFPSSLRNISKALVYDGYAPLSHGNLFDWAKQGVLLLNTVLTVQEGIPHGHQSFHWQIFTNALLTAIAKNHRELVWLLWGKSAQKKIPLIEKYPSHLILTASHPSGLGVYQTDEPFLLKGNLGSCGHFKKTNEWLSEHQEAPITWSTSLI
jgi:uracil-DNA glycosylase